MFLYHFFVIKCRNLRIIISICALLIFSPQLGISTDGQFLYVNFLSVRYLANKSREGQKYIRLLFIAFFSVSQLYRIMLIKIDLKKKQKTTTKICW